MSTDAISLDYEPFHAALAVFIKRERGLDWFPDVYDTTARQHERYDFTASEDMPDEIYPGYLRVHFRRDFNEGYDVVDIDLDESLGGQMALVMQLVRITMEDS